MREAQASERNRLERLMGRVGLAPVEADHVLGVLAACVCLGQVYFFVRRSPLGHSAR